VEAGSQQEVQVVAAAPVEPAAVFGCLPLRAAA
jgi:hypothetical protein